MMDRAIAALGDFFQREIPRLTNTYNWKIPSIEGFEQSGAAGYQPNLELKNYLRGLWEKASYSERVRLSKVIVSDWGGVRANADATLEKYVQEIEKQSVATPIKGVASYSKIFSIVYPDRYAIYDARVAACLNAIQLNAGLDKGVTFNYVPGRNNVVGNSLTKEGFTQKPQFSVQALSQSGWIRIKRDDTYHTYLKLLKACMSNYKDASLAQLEMALFANAETQCLKAMNS